MPDPAALSPASQAWHRFLDDLRASTERVDAALASMNDVERAVAQADQTDLVCVERGAVTRCPELFAQCFGDQPVLLIQIAAQLVNQLPFIQLLHAGHHFRRDPAPGERFSDAKDASGAGDGAEQGLGIQRLHRA